MAQQPIEVFFSYSREDKPLRDKLEIHLSSLKRQGVISAWHDRQIVAGSEWEEEIDRHMRTADIILLLISPDFVHSKYCYEIELPDAIARHEAGEACVVPILLRPVVGWKNLPFAKLQIYPSGGKPIMQWSHEDDAFFDIGEGIAVAVEQLLKRREQKQLMAEQERRSQLEEQTKQEAQDRRAEQDRREARVQPKQAEAFVEDLGKGVMLEMVSIPGGTFKMGSPATEKGRYDNESPQHLVSVSTFFMGRYAVTQAQYEAVVGKNPSHFKGAKRPVEQVSWNDAQEFCQKLSQKTGRKYRLPSEAEWEYACRAGTTTPFHFGETITSTLANYDGVTHQSEPKGEYRRQTIEIGSFLPNTFGLHDMHGNIWEWCEDIYHKNYENAPTNGSAWNLGGEQDTRLLRGGSWRNAPRSCRSAFRNYRSPSGLNTLVGFRVVAVLS